MYRPDRVRTLGAHDRPSCQHLDGHIGDGPGGARPFPNVDRGTDLDATFLKIRECPEVCPHFEARNSCAHDDPKQAEVTPRGAREHDSGAIVVCKHKGELARPRREDHALRADVPEPIELGRSLEH